MNDTEHASLAAAFVAALHELEDITRDHTATIKDKDTGAVKYAYTYADLGSVVRLARQVLHSHGLGVHQEAHSDQPGAVSVTTVLWHTSGESIRSLPLTMPAKGGAQDVGSAITYARRYALMAFLGLATDDDDGAGAQRATKAADDHAAALGRRARQVQGDLRTLSAESQTAIKRWAGDRSLALPAMIEDEAWLVQVESWLDERGAVMNGTRDWCSAPDADPHDCTQPGACTRAALTQSQRITARTLERREADRFLARLSWPDNPRWGPPIDRRKTGTR